MRSEDAEANDSIGGDETLHESAPVVSFAIAVTAFAATDLAFSPRDDASRSPRMLGLCSDCDCALATSFAHVSRCYLYLCRSFGCVLASCVWSAGDAHAMQHAWRARRVCISLVFCAFFIL